MAAKKKDQPTITACHDRERRTCIQVDRTPTLVKFIPLDVVLGLEVHTTSADSFDQRFTPMEGYPAAKACQLFLSYSQNIGATKEALGYLGQVINISDQEAEMATRKKQETTDKVVAAKPAAKKVSTKPAAIKKVAAKAPAKPAAKSGEKKTSAAQMFQDLIMAGKLTDEQIFAKVQAEFGLDDSKRGYVKWYRNNLKKKGSNPPDAK